MIMMQYSFTLPADYDMGIIEARIKEKGPSLDGFPGLGFKAYLSARKGDPVTKSRENLYAPFYLWGEEQGADSFICGQGFDTVSEAFGRPSVKTWIGWQAVLSSGALREARYATREILPIGRTENLNDVRARERQFAEVAQASLRAIAAVAAFEPTAWTCVRLRLWREIPAITISPETQIYDVGYVAIG